MKASELIKELQTLIEEHGDLRVTYNDTANLDRVADIVEWYDINGDKQGTAVEFHII